MPSIAQGYGEARDRASAPSPAASGHDDALQYIQMRRASSAARVGQSRDVRSAVQYHAEGAGGDAPGGAGGDVQRIAAAGLEGSAGRLPHLDPIQRSFGRHDVSGVAAHVGGPAGRANEQLGSQAYATGNSTAFKASPDLHTAAHEAAHVVQQRQGVSLKGGVGQVGDPYERHADAVADRVVQGQSAEDLLSRGPGGGSGGRSGGGGESGGGGRSVQHLQFRGHDGAGRAVQFNGPGTTPTTPATPTTAGQGQQGAGFIAGEYTQVQLSARIPTPIAGLTVEISITGKYTRGQERGRSFVEAEGVVRVSLGYRLLFLNLSVFLQGGLKFKVQNTDDWQGAFNAAFEDISHWVAARELANLPAKKREVQGLYDAFNMSVFGEIGGLRGSSAGDRHTELSQENRPVLWWNSRLANLIDARNTLVDNVRNVFSDMNGSIVGDEVYPSTTWMRDQIQPHLNQAAVTDDELSAIRDALVNESDRRKTTIGGQMDRIPALSNNPNVEFEGNLQIGFQAGVSINSNTSAQIELAAGLRISDSMNAATFDTSTQQVFTASMQVSGEIRGANARGQLAYEGVGPRPTEPQQFKITGQVLAGMQAETQDPSAYSSTLQGVKDRLVRAGQGAGVGGSSVLGAIGTSIKREMADNRSAQWSRAGSCMAGFAVELKFKRENGGIVADGGKVEFVIVRSIGGGMGVFSGSLERGNSVGVTW